ncbi:MAG: endonuclease/exonuclease/phosphatase family protein [Vulcanimicrobiota bacterium]
MALYSASPLSNDLLTYSGFSGAPPVPLAAGAALARLGGSSPLSGLQAPSWSAQLLPMQQLMQLELELMLMLAGLMLGSPNQRQAISGLAGLSGSGGGGITGHTPPAYSQPGGKASFNVASFNVLGSSHTAGGGNKPGMRDGAERMRGAVDAMQQHNVDIAGMQEFQGPQQAAFKKLAPGYAMAAEQDNAVVWNKDKFKLVERRSVTIPYFEGHARKMPVVQLEDRQTGKRVWVVNIHNPADTKDHPHNAANRAKAISIEQHLMRELQATGVPVLFVGDFNERNTVDNDMSQVGMNSARPNGARSEIDWVLGSQGINFSNYTADHSTQSSGTSDHPLIVSTATI